MDGSTQTYIYVDCFLVSSGDYPGQLVTTNRCTQVRSQLQAYGTQLQVTPTWIPCGRVQSRLLSPPNGHYTRGGQEVDHHHTEYTTCTVLSQQEWKSILLISIHSHVATMSVVEPIISTSEHLARSPSRLWRLIG